MHRLLAVALTAALLCLSACGGEDDPPVVTDPTVPVTSSPTTTATGPVEPTIPPAAARQTKAGAIAFVRYYWKVVDYAQATGDTTLLRTLGLKRCAACDGGADWIDKVHRRGGVIRGGSHTFVRSWTPRPESLKSGYLGVVVKLKVTAQEVRSAGGLNHRYRAGPDVVSMLLRDVGTEWRIASWHVLS